MTRPRHTAQLGQVDSVAGVRNKSGRKTFPVKILNAKILSIIKEMNKNKYIIFWPQLNVIHMSLNHRIGNWIQMILSIFSAELPNWSIVTCDALKLVDKIYQLIPIQFSSFKKEISLSTLCFFDIRLCTNSMYQQIKRDFLNNSTPSLLTMPCKTYYCVFTC